MKKTACLTFLFVLFSAFSPAAHSHDLEKVSLKLDWRHSVQFLGYYVAQERGYYADQGLEVTIHDVSSSLGTSLVPGEVESGQYDIGSASSALIWAQKEGQPLVALASLYQFSPQVLFARTESGITFLADIKGKSVAIKNDSWRNAIKEMLAVMGISMEEIHEVKAGFDLTPFYERMVDVWAGYLTNEVVRARMKGLELVTFPVYEYGVTFPSNVLFSSARTLGERSEMIVRFLRATMKGWEWAVNNPEKAVELFIKRFPENPDDRPFLMRSFEASIPLIRPPGVMIGSIDCLKHASSVGDTASPGKVCNTAFLEKARSGASGR